ncbi:MAG: SOS response-associated peptidase family protein, partial [Hydrogenibacillus sp.]|nr:SOS response-associated peptidase family protein [Hydrogenibacillus sp.]
MCGRFVLDADIRALAERYQAVVGSDAAGSSAMRPRYNIAPSTPVVAVAPGAAGGRRLGALRWGLRLKWRPAAPIINVRRESVQEKPYFRRLLVRRRLIVPATGFY